MIAASTGARLRRRRLSESSDMLGDVTSGLATILVGGFVILVVGYFVFVLLAVAIQTLWYACMAIPSALIKAHRERKENK